MLTFNAESLKLYNYFFYREIISFWWQSIVVGFFKCKNTPCCWQCISKSIYHNVYHEGTLFRHYDIILLWHRPLSLPFINFNLEMIFFWQILLLVTNTMCNKHNVTCVYKCKIICQQLLIDNCWEISWIIIYSFFHCHWKFRMH